MPLARWKLNRAAVSVTTWSASSVGAGLDSLSPVVSNDQGAELDLYGTFRLAATFSVAPVLNEAIECYMHPLVSGGISTYRALPTSWVTNFIVEANTGTQFIITSHIFLPASNFRLLLVNRTSQTFTLTSFFIDFYRIEVT